MTKKNPYRTVERVLEKICTFIYMALVCVVLGIVLIAYPIYQTIAGAPWWSVLLPLWVVLAFAAAVALAGAWVHFVAEPWRRRKYEWERNQWLDQVAAESDDK